MSRAMSEVFRFREWSLEVERWTSDALRRLHPVRRPKQHVDEFFVDPYQLRQRHLDDTVDAIREWAIESARLCQETLQDADIVALGYFDWDLSLLPQAHDVALVPALHYRVPDGPQVDGGPLSLVIRPQRRLGGPKAEIFWLCTSLPQDWENWRTGIKRVATAPLEELIAAGELVLLPEDTPSFESPGHPGRTYYRVEGKRRR
jgi:hypothetical protein